jgi:4-hydroxybenzoate polyprenyltransferase
LNAQVAQKRDSVYLKLVALLSSVRWKNVLFTAIAQYIAFLFAFNTKEQLWHSLHEYKVHFIIFSTALILAGGYIINNFYDVEKDLVNRPHRTRFQNLVSRGFKLNLYLLLNLVGLSVALIASWRIFLFFLFFAFALWVYSHKLSKIVLIRELSASFLTVMAFFSLVLYYKMMNIEFFLYGMSLFFFLFAREMYKDIIWVKGDVVFGYESITTKIGVEISKRSKPEFYYIWVVIAVFKVSLLYLIYKNTDLMHRIIQLIILLYILGIVWL